jgi:uncharacterized protein (TIGR02453 family)
MKKTLAKKRSALRVPTFSEESIRFLARASKQKNPDWLEKNREDFETHLQLPLRQLAQVTRDRLQGLAPLFHFPQKGIGRLKRSSLRVGPNESLYKDWFSYSASRPAESRFEHHPNLYFVIRKDDPDGDHVLVAGGLYMPSSRQVRAIREAIARDATPFHRLFAEPAFKKRFPGGFCADKIASRVPRGFDPLHPEIQWLKLQAFYVWRSYKPREFKSPQFAETVAQDWALILKLTQLLDRALAQPASSPENSSRRAVGEDLQAPRWKADF